MRGTILLPLTPPILLVEKRKLDCHLKGQSLQILSLLKPVTVHVFNLFSIYDTEQMYFILFVKDPLYYYPFFFIFLKE